MSSDKYAESRKKAEEAGQQKAKEIAEKKVTQAQTTSQAQAPQESEASKQLKLHGISYATITQQQFDQLSPAAQAEILRQQEVARKEGAGTDYFLDLSERVGVSAGQEAGVRKREAISAQAKVRQEQTEFQARVTKAEKKETEEEARLAEFAREYEAQKGIGTDYSLSIYEGGQQADGKPLEITRANLERVNKLRESLNLPRLEEITPVLVYEVAPVTIAKGIVAEGKAKGATGIQVFSMEEKLVGGISIKDAEEPLTYLLKTGEFKYSFVVPKPEGERKKAKEEFKQFKGFVAEYQRLGATFDIIKDGKVISTTSKEHPLHEILKTQKTEGEVTIAPTPRLIITGERQPQPESATKEKARLAIATPFYNLGAFIYFAPKSMAEAFETAPKEAKSPIDIFTKGFSPKTTTETGIYQLPDPTVEYLTTGKIPQGVTPQERDIYLAANTALFVLGGTRAKAAPTKTVTRVVPKPALEKPIPQVRMYKPLNPYRTPLPKDIFEFDTARPPEGSATIAKPRNKFFEDISKETEVSLQKRQTKLLEPTPPKVTTKTEPPLPEETNILGRRGKPPIQRPTTEATLSRAEVVEATTPRLEHEVFSVRGQKLSKTFGETQPLGALTKIRAEKPAEPVAPEVLNPLGRRGKPPIQRPTTEELPPSRAEKVELERRLYPEKGVGALGKEVRKLVEVQEVKGYKPEIKEFYKRPGKIDTERLLDIEKPEVGAPKEFTEALTRKKVQPTKPKQPFKASRETKEKAESGFREVTKEGRPVLLQIEKKEPKLATKAITRRKTRTEPEQRPAVALTQEEEETYTTKYKPRSAVRQTYVIIPKTSLDITPKLTTKPKVKQGVQQRIISQTVTRQVQKPRVTQKQRERFALIPSGTGTPRTKLDQPQPEKQKQPQKLVTEIIIPPKKIVIPVAIEPPKPKRRVTRPRETKLGERAEFIANVPITRIEGIYKRREITYGLSRVSKLVRQDIGKERKKYGSFVKGSESSFLSKSKPNIIKPLKGKTIRI